MFGFGTGEKNGGDTRGRRDRTVDEEVHRNWKEGEGGGY